MVAIPFALTKTVIFPAGVNWIYMMLIIWLVAVLTIGRGWCSWACFYGGWDEGASALAKKPRLNIDLSNDKIRYFGFAMLAFVVLASLGTLIPVYCEWLCPFKLVTEFGEVDSLRAFVSTIIFILVFFSLVIVLPFLTKKRVQCMSFCPFGAMQSLLNKFNLYRVRIDTDKCTQCMKCVKTCRTLSLKIETIKEKKGQPLITCTRCGECMTVCPQGAIDYSYVLCKHNPGLGKKLYERLNRKKGLIAKILKPVVLTVHEVLSARAMFMFSGYFFGMVFLSSFGTGTLHRFLNLFINGSFLLT
jgi:polyferredoxin